MKQTITIVLAALVMVLLPFQASALDAVNHGKQSFGFPQRVSMGIKASTLGFGVEVAAPLSDKFYVRAGGNQFDFSMEQEFDDLELNLDANLNLSSFTLFADWYPRGSRGIFHITAGLLVGNNYVAVKGVPLGNYEFGGYVITPEDIGDLSIKISAPRVNPYAGIGFGRSVPNRRVSLNFELGALYLGPPVVEMEATGMIRRTGEQGDLIEENMNDYRFWPVVSTQLNVKLFQRK